MAPVASAPGGEQARGVDSFNSRAFEPLAAGSDSILYNVDRSLMAGIIQDVAARQDSKPSDASSSATQSPDPSTTSKPSEGAGDSKTSQAAEQPTSTKNGDGTTSSQTNAATTSQPPTSTPSPTSGTDNGGKGGNGSGGNGNAETSGSSNGNGNGNGGNPNNGQQQGAQAPQQSDNGNSSGATNSNAGSQPSSGSNPGDQSNAGKTQSNGNGQASNGESGKAQAEKSTSGNAVEGAQAGAGSGASSGSSAGAGATQTQPDSSSADSRPTQNAVASVSFSEQVSTGVRTLSFAPTTVTSGSSTFTTSTAITTSGTFTTQVPVSTTTITANNLNGDGSSSKKPVGAIVGGTLGALFGLAILISLLMVFKRRRNHINARFSRVVPSTNTSRETSWADRFSWNNTPVRDAETPDMTQVNAPQIPGSVITGTYSYDEGIQSNGQDYGYNQSSFSDHSRSSSGDSTHPGALTPGGSPSHSRSSSQSSDYPDRLVNPFDDQDPFDDQTRNAGSRSPSPPSPAHVVSKAKSATAPRTPSPLKNSIDSTHEFKNVAL